LEFYTNGGDSVFVGVADEKGDDIDAGEWSRDLGGERETLTIDLEALAARLRARQEKWYRVTLMSPGGAYSATHEVKARSQSAARWKAAKLETQRMFGAHTSDDVYELLRTAKITAHRIANRTD
jgi:hypothetical protein